MLGAGLLAAGLAVSAATAQPLPPYYHRGTVAPAYAAAVPPSDVAAIVRSAGLVPLSPPFRHGLTYRLRAVEPAGYEVHVVVSAWSGRILRVHPVPAAPVLAGNILPAPHARPPGRVALAPDADGLSDLPLTAGAAPTPSDAATGALPGAGSAARPAAPPPPPLPRPRPRIAAAPIGAASALRSAPPPTQPVATVPAAASSTDARGGTAVAPAAGLPAPAPALEE